MGIKPTCKEVHRLVSEQMDRDLTMVEKTRLRLHMMICDACTNFSGQMKVIRRAMHQFPLDKD
jgi:predicted anti-sigma-YlaC factor YlaD